jgi:hypothetical protein
LKEVSNLIFFRWTLEKFINLGNPHLVLTFSVSLCSRVGQIVHGLSLGLFWLCLFNYSWEDYHLDCQDIRYVEDDMFREGVVCYLMLWHGTIILTFWKQEHVLNSIISDLQNGNTIGYWLFMVLRCATCKMDLLDSYLRSHLFLVESYLLGFMEFCYCAFLWVHLSWL